MDKKNEHQNIYLLPGAVIIAAILVSATILYSPGGSSQTSSFSETPGEASYTSEVINALVSPEDPQLGNKDAEVILVWWGDFNCMFCRKFATESFPKIREVFVESGDIQVVYKNFITMGADSFTLAKASQAVWQMVGTEDPALYWRWHAQLAEDQPERKENTKPVLQDIIQTTKKVNGIDAARMQSIVQTMNTEEIENDIAEGRQMNISGTPGIAIIKTEADSVEIIEGAQPYAVFEQAIKEQL